MWIILQKVPRCIGLGTNATAKDIADTFFKEVSKLHGLPSEIVLDMDANFGANFGNHCSKD